MPNTYTITQLSKEFDITTRSIRFYEDEGLLTPVRKGRKRIYSGGDHVRLKLILRGKRLGFSLKEVGEIIHMYNSESGEETQLHHFLRKIGERRALLEQKRQDIEITLSELDTMENQCRKRLGSIQL
ncbi:MerR family DNA-binding transcriptional regulator [Pseudomonadota bacterium]